MMPGEADSARRIAEASDWFARMRGPNAAAYRTAFEAWRRVPEHAQAYEEIATIWSISAAAQPAPSAPAIKLNGARRSALMAVGLGGAILVGVFVPQVWHKEAVEQSATILAGTASPRRFTLSDGTSVTLTPGSRIACHYSSSERELKLLSGSARFSVAHDPSRPFVVIAGTRAIVAHGTVFEVRLGRDQLEVSLLQGAVDLERRTGTAPAQVVAHLRPGQRAIFSGDEAVPHIALAETISAQNGMSFGEGMSLADIVAEANRHGTTKLVLAEPALGDLRVTGGFNPADSRDLAFSLAAAFDLSLSQGTPNSITLSQKQITPDHGT